MIVLWTIIHLSVVKIVLKRGVFHLFKLIMCGVGGIGWRGW